MMRNAQVGEQKLRRLLALFLSAFACTMTALSAHAENRQKAARPNIVLIMADDLGYSDLGCYGSEIKTPHLDRLAREGMRFSQFYNCGLCSHTRFSLMTGLWPRKDRHLSAKTITLGQALRGAAYRPSISGKWNLQNQQPASPLHWGFDRFYGILDSPDNYFDPTVSHHPMASSGRRPLAPHRLVWDDERMLTDYPDDYFLTDAITDHAVRSIHDFAAQEPPFLVYVPYYAPHAPIQAKPAAIARCRDRYAAGWDVLREQRFRRLRQLGLAGERWQLPASNSFVVPWTQAKNKAWQALRMAVYAAMVETMDQGIGRILAALDETGVADNTLVLFLSDNGGKADRDLPMDRPDIAPGPADTFCTTGPGWGQVMNAPFRGTKQSTWEGGIATPLLARWPGVIEAGSLTHQVGHVIDMLPTLVELAGGSDSLLGKESPVPAVDGKSLVPVLRGRARAGHERLYWTFRRERLEGNTVVDAGKAGAIRQGNWKLNWNEPSQQWELYDLSNDRTETKNLAEMLPERVAQMVQAYESWSRSVEGP